MSAHSWGVWPSFEEFERLFNVECPDGLYRITHGSESHGRDRPSGGEYTCSELWAELHRIWGLSESANAWVSDILYSLGWEWV